MLTRWFIIEKALVEVYHDNIVYVRELCEKQHISLAKLCKRIGQTPQNFNKKLKRGTVSYEEMLMIVGTLNVEYKQAFILPDGNEIDAGSKEGIY